MKGERKNYLGDIHYFFKSRIAAIGMFPDNTLCVATYGSGIALVKDDSIVHQITMVNGLSSNNCRSLFIKENEIFAGTDAGVNRIAVHSDTFTITKYRGVDPEVQGGIDNNFYPRPRIFSLTVGLDF